MAQNYNVQMNRFNGTDYDTVMPKNILTGASDPTTSTVGIVGQFYLNTATNNVFICQNIVGSVYTWGTVTDTYTKQQVISDVTKTNYGLASTATPDDAFNILSNTVLYTASQDLRFEPKSMNIQDGLSKIAFGNGVFVATPFASGTNRIYKYTNGGEWTQYTASQIINYLNLSFVGDRFVSISSIYRGGSYSFVSNDGVNWTKSGLISTTKTFNNVAYGNGIYVSCGLYESNTVHSTDATAWIDGDALPSISGNWIVSFGSGKFVAIAARVSGGSNIAAYSTNGSSWNTITLPISKEWSVFNFVNDRFIAVDLRDGSYLYSFDGISWINGTLPTVLSSPNMWNTILYGNGLYVISSSTSNYCYSVDGTTWKASTITGNGVGSMAFGNNNFVSVGDNHNTFQISLNQILLTDVKGNALGVVTLS